MGAIPSIPVCLTIAGSDSGGGAGIQADLRTFNFFRTYGATAITAVTAQNPSEVTAIHAVPAADVAAQIRAVCKGYRLGAVKTGMLFSVEIISAIAEELAEHQVPVIVDPVMVATSGAKLLEDDAIVAMVEQILPIASLITPNIPEAELLLQHSIGSPESMRTAALELAGRFGGVLLKGGHMAANPGVDLLAWGKEVYELACPAIDVSSSHGTGCTLSSAIAAKLALGSSLLEAAVAAKAFVWQSLQDQRELGDFVALYPPAKLDVSRVQVKRLG